MPLWRPRAADAASAEAILPAIAASLDERVAAVLPRIRGEGRRLLALRNYLRAGSGLAERWSWSSAQIDAFMTSPEYRALQAEVEKVREAFAAANPGFELWVNPEVRSLETQLTNWNRNDSVSRAAAGLHEAFRAWRNSAAVKALPPADLPQAAANFLREFTPEPIPTLAAPGLSPHGQMRAIDFQVGRDGRTVAGPRSATIAAEWDKAGWTEKLAAAVKRGSDQFAGPLQSPREPWHYTYSPARVTDSAAAGGP